MYISVLRAQNHSFKIRTYIHGCFMSRDLKSHDVCTVRFTYIDTNCMHKHIAPSIGCFHTLCTVHRACKGVFAEHGGATQ